MQTDRPMLLPAVVPWQVSPSAPCLRLTACEDAAGVTCVDLVAHFGLDDRGEAALPSANVTAVASQPGPFKAAVDHDQHSHRLVRIKFELAIAARMLPAVSDHVVFDVSGFDTTHVPGSDLLLKDYATWLADFQNSWLRSGKCPDPRVYEVKNSRWIAGLGRPAEQWRHIVIEGHDSYVEVIARGWTWEMGQPA